MKNMLAEANNKPKSSCGCNKGAAASDVGGNKNISDLVKSIEQATEVIKSQQAKPSSSKSSDKKEKNQTQRKTRWTTRKTLAKTSFIAIHMSSYGILRRLVRRQISQTSRTRVISSNSMQVLWRPMRPPKIQSLTRNEKSLICFIPSYCRMFFKQK